MKKQNNKRKRFRISNFDIRYYLELLISNFGFVRRLRTRTYIGLALILILLPVIIISTYRPSDTSAEWMDEAWQYRKKIPITNNTTAETDVYVAFDGADVLDTSAAGFTADCGDIRFTNRAGELLPFIVNSGCDSASTDIDVLFSTFPAGDMVIYMYYGNPTVADGFRGTAFSSEASNYTIGTPASEEVGPGPISFWKFDEGVDNTCSGGTNDVCDSTAQGNDGAKTGATWQNEEQCISGKCLWFDGSDDNINTNNDFSWTSSDPFTISTWIRPNTVSGEQGIIGKTSFEYVLGLKDDNVYFYYWIDGGATSPIQLQGTTNLDTSKWYHITVSSDGSTATMYLNGVVEATDSSVSGTYQNRTETTKIGYSYTNFGAGGATTYFDGFIDEVKIYPYARSADEIKANYNQYANVLGTQDTAFLNDGLVGYWPMEDNVTGDAQTVTDKSGNGADSTTVDGNNNTGMDCDQPGKFGLSCKFDGIDDYTTASPDKTNRTFVTIAGWVNFDGANNQNEVDAFHHLFGWNYEFFFKFRSYTSEPGAGYYVWLQGTTTNGTTNALSKVYPLPVKLSGWHHLAGTYDGNYARIFLDGEEVANFAAADTGIKNQSRNFEIGGGDNAIWYDHSIDEVRVYYRALSPAEVKSLYEWAPGPDLHWKLDEGSGTTVNDISGNGNTGTVTCAGTSCNLPTWQSDAKYGKSLFFNPDATDKREYVTASSVNLSSSVGSKMTWGMWVKPSASQVQSGTSAGWLLRNGTGADENYGISLESPSGGFYRVGFSGYDGTSWYTIRTTDYIVPAEQWSHLSVTYSQDEWMKVYLNGVFIEQVAWTHNPTVQSTSALNFGSNSGAYQNYNGFIDDFRLYKYERTPGQVVEDMNAGHPIGGSPVGSQVIYYKFDEQQGTTANDEVNNQDGTIDSNLTWLTNASCKVNGCLQWDAAGEEVSIATASDADVDFNGSEEFSGSAWVYVTTMPGSSNQDAIIAKWDDTGNLAAYKLYVENDDADTTGNFEVQLYDESASQAITASQANDLVAVNTWYHVAFTFNGGTAGAAGDLKIYVNGQYTAQNTANASFLGVEDLGSDFTIGEYDPGDTEANNTAFTGYIDEVKIYNSQLSAAQVKIDYNAGLSTNFGVGASTEASLLSDGAGNAPVGHWNFDENTGTTTVYDTSGNGNDLTMNGSMTEDDWVLGKYGSSLELDGSNDTLVGGDTTSLKLTTAGTVQAWIKPSNYLGGGSWAKIINKGNWGGGKNDYSIYYTSGGTNIRFEVDGATTVQYVYMPASTTPLNTWTHVAMTWNGIGNPILVYINGVQTSGTTTGNLTEVPDTSTYNFEITAAGYPYDGKIDEVKIYNYARTPAQIAYDYNRGKPIGHWRFDECQGATATDYGSGGNNGTITIGATGSNTSLGTCSGSAGEAWADGSTGKLNSSLEFDGTDDYVEVNHSSILSPATTVTIAAWVKTTSAVIQTIVEKEEDSNPWDGYELAMNNVTSGKISFWVGGSAWTTGTTSVNDGNWHHVVATCNGSTAKIYIDGIEDASQAQTCDTADAVDNGTLHIGARFATEERFWDGQIDDVRVYNYALSAAQIKQVYNNGFAQFFGPSSGSP